MVVVEPSFAASSAASTSAASERAISQTGWPAIGQTSSKDCLTSTLIMGSSSAPRRLAAQGKSSPSNALFGEVSLAGRGARPVAKLRQSTPLAALSLELELIPLAMEGRGRHDEGLRGLRNAAAGADQRALQHRAFGRDVTLLPPTLWDALGGRSFLAPSAEGRFPALPARSLGRPGMAATGRLFAFAKPSTSGRYLRIPVVHRVIPARAKNPTAR